MAFQCCCTSTILVLAPTPTATAGTPQFHRGHRAPSSAANIFTPPLLQSTGRVCMLLDNLKKYHVGPHFIKTQPNSPDAALRVIHK